MDGGRTSGQSFSIRGTNKIPNREVIEHAQQNAFVLHRGQDDPHGGGARKCRGDDQITLTSPSLTPNSFAVSANITAANDAGHTQSAVELRILSAQLEWIVDATRSSYRKRTHVGRFRRQN
jgi:hypothetical protein